MHQPATPLFSHTLISPISWPRDEMDNCKTLSDCVSHLSRKEHEDYWKGKILLRAAFYSQFVFICPPAPLGCLWERVSTCFIGRYCVSQSKSLFTHRCEHRTSVSVPLLFVSGWNYLGVNGFVRPTLCWCRNLSLCVFVGKYKQPFYLFAHKKISIWIYTFEMQQSTRYTRFPLCCLLSHFV